MSFEIVGKVDVKNKSDQLLVVNIGLGEDGEAEHGKVGIGGTKAVSEELRDTIGGVLNINNKDNDVLDLLSELLLGQTDGRGDDKASDGVAGIDGVDLIGLDGDSFTIQLTNGSGATDTIVFAGEGVAKIIRDVAEMSNNSVDIKDSKHQFEIIEVPEDGNLSEGIGGTSGELRDTIGGTININNRDDDVLDLASEFLTGSTDGTGDDKGVDDAPGIAGVELIDIDADSFAFMTNGDTVLVLGAGAQIAEAATQADVKDNKFTGEIADQTDISNPNSAIGATGSVGNGELNDVVGGAGIDITNNNNDVENLILEFTTGVNPKDGAAETTSGIDGVDLIGLDEDSVTFFANGDTIIVEHDYFML